MGCSKGIELCLNFLHPQLLGELTELVLIVHLSPDNIELRTAASTLRIHFIALTGSSQGTAPVEKAVLDFSFESIARISHAQHLPGRCAL